MANKRKAVETPLELFIKNHCYNRSLEEIGKTNCVPKSTMYSVVYKRQPVEYLSLRILEALQKNTRHTMTLEQIVGTLKDYQKEYK